MVVFETPVVFETARLVVRPWTQRESDVDRILDMYSRWEVARWLGSVPRALESRAEAAGAVDRWAARSEADGRLGIWAAQVRDTGVVAGTVLLVHLTDSGGEPGGAAEVEVGWHLHPDSWGNGYATEAGRGTIEHGFAGGLTEIFAVVRPENEPSLAVCRRLGMSPLGRTNQWYGSELEGFRITAP
jgi:RimJ/RimL family protein N-acetyltransferase